jgi:hypothetical protein
MIDNIQIVLFFSPKTSFNPNQIAADINKKIPFLGNGIVLPINHNDPNMPIIIFNENQELNVSMTSISANIVFGEKDLKKYKEVILKILNIFDYNKVSFSRIGMVITRALPKTDIKKLKSKLFKDEEIIEAKDFLVAWHTPIHLDGTKFNCWERYFIDTTNNNLVGVFDINTPVEETYYINDEFVDKCITQSIRYVDRKIKK